MFTNFGMIIQEFDGEMVIHENEDGIYMLRCQNRCGNWEHVTENWVGEERFWVLIVVEGEVNLKIRECEKGKKN